MPAPNPRRGHQANLWFWVERFRPVFGLLLWMVLAGTTWAQTTTIQGTVFDPRTTSSALPLPSVLVYVTTGTVQPLPSGVQCLTYSAPKDAISYAYTATDGTFTLDNIPQNTDYTLVIQAGKWRRQFAVSVGGSAITSLNLHMPADHTQGDIPMIAISTGSADGVECVLHDMGIADTEFTDDTGTVNPGGHIHLYLANQSSGASVTSSTPYDSALLNDQKTLNGYDMVMFPCQGSPIPQDPDALSNIVSFANAGGRVFTTHFSYVWLDPDSPYNSQFPPVAHWHTNQSYPFPGPATINTGFTDGATLAQWLQNAGASYLGQYGQVTLNTVRHDLDSVIPPTQAWLTLNDTANSNPIMQFTFNAPVGAAASAQCGRVLFNEYHVIDQSNGIVNRNTTFPAECHNTSMSPQEQMLEYALFDLSAFVQPVIIPTITVAFDPSPFPVKSNDAADQVTIKVTNTSTTTSIDPSAILTLALPAGLTATALNDPTGGWQCTVSTLRCTRTASIASSTTDSVILTVSVGAYPPGGPANTTGTITATVSSPTFSNDVVATDTVLFQQAVVIHWEAPAPVVYPTALSNSQLNATSSVSGTLTYSPSAGTILPPGHQTLNATFTPADIVNYLPANASVALTVVPATLPVNISADLTRAFIQNPVEVRVIVPSPAATATGTITLLDGATELGSSSLSDGTSSFTTSTLGVGTHAISGNYSGDSNYNAATSATLLIVIQDFALDATGATQASDTVTVYPGTTARYYLQVSPVGGTSLPAAVDLSVAGLPANAATKFSQAVIQAGSGTTAVELDVTPPSLNARNTARSPFERSLPIAFGLILLPFARRFRRTAARWTFVILAALGTLTLWTTTGCGAIAYTPKSFPLTITAKSGGLSHTTTVKLIVE